MFLSFSGAKLRFFVIRCYWKKLKIKDVMEYLPVSFGYWSGLFFWECLTVCLNWIVIRLSFMKGSVSVISTSSVS